MTLVTDGVGGYTINMEDMGGEGYTATNITNGSRLIWTAQSDSDFIEIYFDDGITGNEVLVSTNSSPQLLTFTEISHRHGMVRQQNLLHQILLLVIFIL